MEVSLVVAPETLYVKSASEYLNLAFKKLSPSVPFSSMLTQGLIPAPLTVIPFKGMKERSMSWSSDHSLILSAMISNLTNEISHDCILSVLMIPIRLPSSPLTSIASLPSSRCALTVTSNCALLLELRIGKVSLKLNRRFWAM